VQLFLDHDVPGGPVYDTAEIVDDPHFQSRSLLYEPDHPPAAQRRLFGTPVKIDGEVFSAAPAPQAGEHSRSVLRSVLGLPNDEIDRLRRDRVIGSR